MEGAESNMSESRSLNLDDSIRKLCLKLFGVISSTGNQCFSPTGICQVLCLLVTVCQEDELKTKLFELLDLPRDYDTSRIYKAWETYLTTLQPDPLKISLGLFSRVGIRKIEFDPEFEIMKNKYGGEIIPLNDPFLIRDPFLAVETVKNWIERATTGATRKIDINLKCVMAVMVSVLSFKGQFKYRKWEVVKDLYFYIDNSIQLKVYFIRTIARMEYAENSDLRAIKLEYENPNYYLLIMRPTHESGRTNHLENMMSSSTDYLTNLKFTRQLMDVYIPRFFVENDMNVLGMFHRMCPELDDLLTFQNHDLYVNAVRQLNRIDVREGKSVDFSFRWKNEKIDNGKRLFCALDPFVYMLCCGDNILFAGRFCNPLEPL